MGVRDKVFLPAGQPEHCIQRESMHGRCSHQISAKRMETRKEAWNSCWILSSPHTTHLLWASGYLLELNISLPMCWKHKSIKGAQMVISLVFSTDRELLKKSGMSFGCELWDLILIAPNYWVNSGTKIFPSLAPKCHDPRGQLIGTDGSSDDLR